MEALQHLEQTDPSLASRIDVDLARSYAVELRGGNRVAVESRDSEVIVSGPAGTGKSRAILEKLWRLALEYPGARLLIVRKTRSSLSESGLVTFEQHVLGPDHPLVQGPQRQNRVKYPLPNGSEIVTGGMDRIDRILSTEYDVIYPQEATELTLPEWETLSTRCRNGVVPFQQMIGDCNPGPSQHWIRKRTERGALKLLYTEHRDNPALWDAAKGEWTPYGEAYMANLNNLTGTTRLRLLEGKWVSSEGVVYDDFDANLHVIDARELPEFKERFRVVDFGFTNPFVCQWWGKDADGRLYLYREIYRTNRIVSEHAAQIKDISRGEVFATNPICDHDAEDRATLQKSLGTSGTVGAWKPILPGIEAVKRRLRVAGDKRPRIFFVRDALVEVDPELERLAEPTSTLQEIEQYVWSDGVDGKKNKEVPVDHHNHGMDAMRYMVAFADKLKTSKRKVASGRRVRIHEYAS